MTYEELLRAQREDPAALADIDASSRAAVLVEALHAADFLNDFGYLDPAGSWDGPAAIALLDTGPAAVGLLREALTDRSPARLSGSEMATLSTLYDYRRCDFAYRYLLLLTGREPYFATDVTARDRDIGMERTPA
jgi:hypothetical protein